MNTIALLSGLVLGGPPGCTPSATQLCLQGGRFAVTVEWALGTASFGPLGSATSGFATLTTYADDTGLANLDGDERIDGVVQVIDGCDFNDRSWVFYAFATDVELEVTVVDTANGSRRVYGNAAANPASPVADTQAFASCTGRRSGLASALLDQRGSSGCGGDVNSSCLLDGRFRLDITGIDFAGGSLVGQPAVVRPAGAAVFLFSPDRPEIVAAVGDAGDGSYRFQASAVTTVGLGYTLTDTQTERSRTYENPLGALTTVLDGAPVTLAIDAPGRATLGEPTAFELVVRNPNTEPTEVDLMAPIPADLDAMEWSCLGGDEVACTQEIREGAIAEPVSLPGRAEVRYRVTGIVAPDAEPGTFLTLEANAATAPSVLNAQPIASDGTGAALIATPVIFAAGFEDLQLADRGARAR